jgi:hypothetical protein
MRRRLAEIAHINRIAGTQHWIATGRDRAAPGGAQERRQGERRGGA